MRMRPWIASAIAVLCAGDAVGQLDPTCGLETRVPFAGHSLPLESPPNPQPLADLEAFPLLPNFSNPIFLAAAPDGSDRLFVVEQLGRIRVFENDPAVATLSTFLDIQDEVWDNNLAPGTELGLLGLAFDPDFASNGHFYVNYTAQAASCAPAVSLCTRIVRFTVPQATPDDADEGSALLILDYAQPFTNHNGGMLAFGPDGMLWIASGDGGSSGDPLGNGQNPSTLLGKLLRIDPRADGFPTDPRRHYQIPPDNPFADGGGAAEIFALGLRNPWRFSFDRVTGDLWIGDVGQNAREEVDFIGAAEIAAPPASAINLGWDVCEGFQDFQGNCAAHASRKPVLDYPHDGATGGFAITGGYVYRGTQIPELFGAYLYADYVSGRLWAFDGVLPAQPEVVGYLSGPSSFGEDRDGELYVTSLSGRIYRIERSGAPPAQFPQQLSQTGLFANVATLTPAPGLIEYEVSAPLWSDRALKRRWIALPGTQQIDFHATEAWSFPVGTAFVKHFELPTTPTTTRRLETRVLLRQIDRWIGLTYRWNAAQTDATLLVAALDESFTVDLGGGPEQQTWHYPSPAECMICHSAPEARVLGARTRQLHREFAYPLRSDDQLHAWSCIGLFRGGLGDLGIYGRYEELGDATAPLQARAHSYLASNCAICHQPGGPAPGNLDLRYRALLGDLNAIGVPPTEGALGIPNALRIAPGAPAQSVLWHRMQSSVLAERMPDGSRVPDAAAVQLFADWIGSGLGALDSDGDGVPDGADNCAHAPNPGQQNTGGFNLGTGANATGDACECGDVDGDGTVFHPDYFQIRQFLSGALVLPADAHRRCLAATPRGECSVADWARLRRALLGRDPAPAPTCAAATQPR
jgi:uncharacterized repeat protein (TIGR03806 family)